MIERLRKRFIRIATLAVAGVLLLLCVTVNAANYISADRQLTQMLRMICDNQGTVPHFPPDGGKPGKKPDGPFTSETPYSTRYFVLRYDGDGDLEQADLTHIAAVSEGVLKMEHGEALVLVDTIERPEEIDLHRAEEMAAEARAELKAKRSAQEQAIANARIARAISRIHVKHDGK